MEIKKEILPKSKIKLEIKVSPPEMRGFFDRAYKKFAPSVEVKGFRPGMAPRALTISAIGENRLNSEIIDLALQETYVQALKKEDIMPVSQPKISIKVVKDLTVDTALLEYDAEIDILPEIKLGDYKKIKLKTKRQKDKEIEAKDGEVEQVISHLQRQKATFSDITRAIKTGDRVEISFEGFEKGVKIENLSSEHYPIILGSGSIIPDFEKNLVGLKKGDKKEFKSKLKDQKDPAGTTKEIDFKVEVLETQETILPELDNKFAEGFQKKTIDELKLAIKEDIINQKKDAQKKQQENEVLEKLLELIKTEIPESLIDQEINRQTEDMKNRVTSMGMTFEKYLEQMKKTEEDFKKDLQPQAEKTIKIGLALGEILKKESAPSPRGWGIDPKDKEAGKKVLERLIENATK